MFPLLVLTSLRDNLCDMAFLGRLYAVGVTNPSGSQATSSGYGGGWYPPEGMLIHGDYSGSKCCVSFRRQPIG